MLSQVFSVGGGVSLYDVASCLAARSYVPFGGLCPWSHVHSGGVSVPGVSVQGESEKRAVRILLECILVQNMFTQILRSLT